MVGMSHGYRASILLFVIPGLLELQRRVQVRGTRFIISCTLGAALWCLWRQFFESGLVNLGLLHSNSFSLIFLVLLETVWWSLVSVLAAFVALYVLHSPLWRATEGRPRGGSGLLIEQPAAQAGEKKRGDKTFRALPIRAATAANKFAAT